MLPYTDFLMKWGHLLIGLSLVSGLMVRVSGPFGILLMITYHFAHMDWPFIENHLSLFVDYHLVYAVVIVFLIAHRAGHICGLDGLDGTLAGASRVIRACDRCSPELARPVTRRSNRRQSLLTLIATQFSAGSAPPSQRIKTTTVAAGQFPAAKADELIK